jgi:16S rRNA (cytidine1402-2'-O)-methyltransferase
VTTPQLGTLYLIPTFLTQDAPNTSLVLPPEVVSRTLALDYFIAENAKSARAFLKAVGQTRAIASIEIAELPKHTDARSGSPESVLATLLAPLLAGHDVGLVSEAGAPAVADPGALIVAAAHAAGIRVVPMVGPSAILLALMASGLNGQTFTFHGYLPIDKIARKSALQAHERASRQHRATQLYIETPYRNQALFDELISTLAPTTRLCIASDLTGANEQIVTRSMVQWRTRGVTLPRVPTMFLFLA